MKKLNVEIKYSPLYRPQAMGMIERQHRAIKDSLKAAIEDMTEKHQNKWLDYLPFVILGKNSSLQPDIGASPNELAFGTGLQIPGQLLVDPDQVPSAESLQNLLHSVKLKTSNPAVQPSRHCKAEKPLPDIPSDVTHVYTRQHKTTGLQVPYEGPFKIDSRPSRSTLKLEVGLYSNGEKRFEIRHLNDVRLAHPDSLTAPASRPKLGRPARSSPVDGQTPTELPTGSQASSNQSTNRLSPDPNPPKDQPAVDNKQAAGAAEAAVRNPRLQNHATSNPEDRVPASATPGGLSMDAPAKRAARSTRNPNPYYVDSIEAHRPWSASPEDIRTLNESINRSMG